MAPSDTSEMQNSTTASSLFMSFSIKSHVPSQISRRFQRLFPLILLVGCSRFHKMQKEFVYVSARQVYLHDRVAAVSNRVGLVTNGEALEVVERGKRFVKVRTPKGEIGWLEDHAIIDDKLYAQFQDLAKKHDQDLAVANGQLRDDLYLHLLPGRDTPHFLLVAGNTKVQMLERGTVPKALPPGAKAPSASPNPTLPKPESHPAQSGEKNPASATPAPAAQSVPMEDWWLIRDHDGHTGWLLANRVDVDVPDEVGQYSEEQRMIAAYPLATVLDDGTGREAGKAKHGGKKTAGGKQETAASDVGEEASSAVPKQMIEYVTVLSPPRNGLPYDFDQVRVFTWSLNHHRYETAYRLRGLQGYLPVKISQEMVNGQQEPVFSFAIADGPGLRIDSETGVTRPLSERTIAFRLEGNIVKRTGQDMNPIVLARDPEQAAQAKAAAKKKKR